MKQLDRETAERVTEMCQQFVLRYVPREDRTPAIVDLLEIVKASYIASAAIAQDTVNEALGRFENAGNN